MINASLVAVIIRVAGLTEKPSLGKMLTHIQPALVELVRFLRNIPGPRRGRRGTEFIVWTTYLRWRTGVRSLDVGLPFIQW